MPKVTFILSVLVLLVTACKSIEKNAKRPAGLNLELLYRVWSVDSMNIGEKTLSGFEMGDPLYEFTRDGQRIKSYTSPPHKESVNYFIRNDSIHYKSQKVLPSSAITILTDSTLVLKNEKTTWKLYIKK